MATLAGRINQSWFGKIPLSLRLLLAIGVVIAIAVVVVKFAVASGSDATAQAPIAAAPVAQAVPAQAPLASQAVQPPAALPAQQVVETGGSSPDSLPTTMGELRSMGVKHNAVASREIRWGWGEEFRLSAFVRNDLWPPIPGWKFVSTNDNTVAGRLLGSTLATITVIAATPEYAGEFATGRPRHTPSDRMSRETIQTALAIAERIFVIKPETTKHGTQYHLQPKNLSARVELDKIRGISEQGLVFSAIITIEVEGEKSLRLRVEERFPSYGIDPKFRILE